MDTYEDPIDDETYMSAVRMLVGDTDPTEPLIGDDVLTFIINMWRPGRTVYYVASMVAESIAARFARETNVSSDSQNLGLGELQSKYIQLAERLMRQHQTLLSGGAVDVSYLDAGQQVDLTVTPPMFALEMHDAPGAGPQRHIEGRRGGYWPYSYGPNGEVL